MTNGLVRRWWLPSLGVLLWLIFFLGIAYSPWRVRLISADGDASLHCSGVRPVGVGAGMGLCLGRVF